MANCARDKNRFSILEKATSDFLFELEIFKNLL